MEASRGNIYALMLAATTFVLSWTVIQPIYTLFVLDMGATLVQLGFLLSLKQFIPLVFRIPLSVVGERVGRARMLLLGLVIAVVSSVLYAFASEYLHLLLITLFESLATGSFNQIAMSTVSDMAPANRQGDAMGRYLTFLGVGMMVGPALCSLLVASLTYSQLYLISALFPVVGLVLLVLRGPRVPRMVRERGEKPDLGAVQSLRMIFGNRNVMLLSYCRASFSTSQAILLALFSIYAVQQLGLSESIVALLFTVRGFANTVARFPAGWLSDRIGRKRPMVAAYGLLVVAFTIIALTKDIVLIGLALAMYGLSWGTRAVSEWTLLTDLVEPEIKTISISYLGSVFGFGSTLGSILSGALTTVLPYSTIFLIAAGLNMGAIPAIMAMKREENP